MKELFTVVLAVACLTGCASTNSKTNSNFKEFSDVIGKDLILLEIQIDSTPSERIVVEDRTNNTYTIKFDGSIVSGVGAPNRYSAPYSLSENQTIKVELLRSTLMASILQNEKIPEHVYYGYLQNSYKWETKSGALILHSRAENNRNVRLVFGL
ncbi:MAG: META domain-containing protein [Treponema sp.]|nr:META domain-containing protein [Treponema sp.]